MSQSCDTPFFTNRLDSGVLFGAKWSVLKITCKKLKVRRFIFWNNFRFLFLIVGNNRSNSPPCSGSPFYLTGSDVYFGGIGVENRFCIHIPVSKASQSQNTIASEPKVDIEGQNCTSVVYVNLEAESSALSNELCYRVRYKVQDRGFYRILISHMGEQRCYVCKVLH